MQNLCLTIFGSCFLATVFAGYADAQAPDLSGIYWATNYSPKIELVGGGELPLNDAGKAAYAKTIAGLKDEDAVLRGPMAGPLFETAVVTELAKCFYHRGLPPDLWYWRSRDGWRRRSVS